MKYKISLHIFRRDLRLDDNTALISALKNSERVIPCFILNKEQLENNEYKSDNLIEFMFNSLLEVDQLLKKRGGKLYLFYGKTEEVIEKLITRHGIDAVYFNQDYTPYSLKRDEGIKKLCEKNQIELKQFHDALLTPPGSILKNDGKPYTIFTPFFRKARENVVSKITLNSYKNYYNQSIPEEEDKSILEKILPTKNEHLLLKGGFNEAINLIEKSKFLTNYSEERNIPSLRGTTLLSAHNKFGTVSIRTVYWSIVETFGLDTEMISELYWRDFFTHIVYHFPHVLGNSYRKKYDKLSWSNNKKLFELWCEGKTGYPIVDAGMRELNKTGYMHNRVRMITASFLVKDLHIDWRWGEKYFAQKLIDYDPAINNGNWQWAASTGCDAQPYFRIFNPWRQQERFDPDCKYIMKWVPELKLLSAKAIHNLSKQKPLQKVSYPDPIVDHSEETALTKAMYASLK